MLPPPRCAGLLAAPVVQRNIASPAITIEKMSFEAQFRDMLRTQYDIQLQTPEEADAEIRDLLADVRACPTCT